MIIGKDSMDRGTLVSQLSNKGYTNETAVETRIVDLEVLGEGEEPSDDQELKEVRKAFIKEQKIEEEDEDSSGADEDEDKEEAGITEEEVSKAINKAEEALESNEEIGYGFMDDVSSEEEKAPSAKV